MASHPLNEAAYARIVWGNLTPPPWASVTFDTSASAKSRQRTLRLTFQAERSTVVMGGHSFPRPRARYQQEVTYDGVASDGVVVALLACARELAWVTREHDPRIGIGPDNLPQSPLFDPPRVRPPAMLEPSADEAFCPFCRGRFTRGEVAWGGGNLLWVHPGCWVAAVTAS